MTAPDLDVIGLGDADVDLYLHVDHIPGRDEKIVASGFELYPGGMTVNFLVALRRLGETGGYHGLVGDDENGRLILENLRMNGIDTGGVTILPGERSFFCVVMLDDSGEKSLTLVPARTTFPEPDDLIDAQLARGRHLHTTAANLRTLDRAIGLAKRFGQTISIDMESDHADEVDELRPLLAQVDLLFVNRNAARTFTGIDSPERAANQFRRLGPRIVCLTMGSEGGIVLSESDTIRYPAFAVPVVDSTGAGDCFAAGFVHGFLNDWPLRDMATFASAVGALSVTGRGGHGGAPTHIQAATFLADRGIRLMTTSRRGVAKS